MGLTKISDLTLKKNGSIMEVIKAWSNVLLVDIDETRCRIAKPSNKSWDKNEIRSGDRFEIEIIKYGDINKYKNIGFVRRLRFDETIEVKEEISITLKKEQAQKECDEFWEELRDEYEKHEKEKRELDFNGNSYDDSSCISNILFNQQGA